MDRPICPPTSLAGKINIADFLAAWFAAYPEIKFDFYLELEFIKQSMIQRRATQKDMHINYIAERFQACFQIDKRMCPYKNVRMHYSDVRSGNLDSRILDILNLFRILDSVPRLPVSIPTLQGLHSNNVAKKISGFFPFTRETAETFFLQSKIMKQLQGIRNSEMKVLLQSYINNLLQQVINIPDLPQTVTHELFKVDSDASYMQAQKHFQAMYTFTLMFPVTIMDAYLLARLLRMIETDSPPRTQVIYAGDGHSKRYREFFAGAGFQTVAYLKSETEGTDYQCLQLTADVLSYFDK